ncbi:caspase-1-A [Microcaecilia unicolor]|uniref:Caspase-1-A-like n=1 Tax=Microcaecilia unicolor TaxID=1415580 RepID=A0A6P7ZW22_9AMPH|nr:caspase-1-A-like [Microcaecilia unicolor]
MAAKELRAVFADFVSKCNPVVMKLILSDLQTYGVLGPAEARHISEEIMTTNDKARTLIDFVIRKGDHASSVFIRCLQERDQHLSRELKICIPSALSTPEASVSAPTEPAWITPCSLGDYQQIQNEAADIYKIKDKGSRKRLAIIICNKDFKQLPNRKGAEVDVCNMRKLLEGLGYDVELQQNLSSEDMKKALKDFSCREEHEHSDSTFIVLMSHGVRKGICGVNCTEEDTDILSLDTVFEIFNNENCRALVEKPKIILIQACRGEKKGKTLVSDSVSNTDGTPTGEWEDDALREIHRESDFACLCSTTPDTLSWRHPTKGSVFIERLIKCLREKACRYPLEELFRQVQFSFSKDFPNQMPTKERTTLTKKFYLLPGF